MFKKSKDNSKSSSFPFIQFSVYLGLSLVLLYFMFRGTTGFPLLYDSLSLESSNFFTDNLGLHNLTQPRSLSRWSFALLYKSTPGQIETQRLFNILIHFLNGTLVFLFLRKIFEISPNKQPSNPNPWLITFLSLVFIAHPIGFYSVSFLIQRYILLGMFFLLLALLSFIHSLQTNSWVFRILTVICFLSAILSKEHTAASLPVFGALWWFQRSKQDQTTIKANIATVGPLGILAILAVAMNVNILGQIYEHAANEISMNLLEGTPILILSQINQSWNFFIYFIMQAIPFPKMLAIYHPLPFPSHVLTFPYILGPFLFTLAIASMIILSKRKYDIAVIALLGLISLFLPEFSVVRYSENFAIYRAYLYLPFFLLLVGRCLISLQTRSILVFFVPYVLILLGMSVSQVRHFESPIAAWKNASIKVDKTPNTPGVQRIFSDLGYAYLSAGKTDEAADAYKNAIEANPSYAPAQNSLAAIYINYGSPKDAVPLFESAAKLDPKNLDYKKNLGLAYVQNKQYKEAIRIFTPLIDNEPNNPLYHVNLGTAFEKLGEKENAILHYGKTLQLEPKNLVAQYSLAKIYGDLKLYNEALIHYQRTLKLKPDLIDALYNSGILFVQLNRFDQASQMFTKVIQTNPNMHLAFFNLGLIEMTKGDYSTALRHFRQVLKIDPSNVKATKKIIEIEETLKNAQSPGT